MTQLNENETKILNELIKQVVECTGDEFGYMEDVNHCGFSKHQFSGYISALSQKGVFDYLDDEFNGQYKLKKEVFNHQ